MSWPSPTRSSCAGLAGQPREHARERAADQLGRVAVDLLAVKAADVIRLEDLRAGCCCPRAPSYAPGSAFTEGADRTAPIVRRARRLVVCPGTRSGRASSTRRRSWTRAGARRSPSSLVRSPWPPARAAVTRCQRRAGERDTQGQRSLDAEGQHRAGGRRRGRAPAARPMRSRRPVRGLRPRRGSACWWRR